MGTPGAAGASDLALAANDASASASLLRMVLDTVADLVLLFELDDDGEPTCVAVSGSWARATGRPSSEWVGRAAREVLPQDALDHLLTHAGAASPAGITYDDRLPLPAGEMELAVTLTAVTGADGNARTAHVLWVGRDVTDQRRGERQLQDVNRELRRSNADLGAFASVASHDLQEPLRMVTSYLELLSRRYREQLDDRADLYIDFAVDGAVRMRALIEALLEYARVRTQEQVVTEVHLDQVVRRVLVDLSTAIEESGGVVSVGPLPEVQGDESQLRRLLQNLVSNALKFSRGAPSVAVHAIEEDGAARIIVDDDGIGVPEAKREAVFEMFGRLHPRTEYSGTGMGLALCQTIVDAHGGRIWIEDSPTGGARVVFTLPNSSEERT